MKRSALTFFSPVLPLDIALAALTSRASTILAAEERSYGRTRADVEARTLREALREFQKDGRIEDPPPQPITELLTAMELAAETQNLATELLASSETELQRRLTYARSTLAGVTIDEGEDAQEDDDDDGGYDDVEEDEPEDDAEEDERSADAADRDTANTSYLEATKAELEAVLAEIQRRANNYDRVASIERIFCDRYGEASATLRDILVSASMLDASQGHHVTVAGATFEPEEIVDEADRFIGPAAARLIADIARVRTQTQSPTPLPAEVALPDPEVPPRLLDGARRRYFLCPCCGDRFARPHSCRQGHCTTPALPYLNLGVTSRMAQVTMLCAYSERSSGYGLYDAPAPRRLIPFGRSVVGRARSGRLIFISPVYAYAILRTKVQRAFPNSTNLCVEMSDAGIHLSETLPDVPTEGGDHDALLSIHSVKRVARTETLALDHWWYRDDLPQINRHEGAVRAYATAYDVFTFRSRPRSEPAVLNTRFYRSGKDQVEHCDLIAAQVDDRVDSPFGPRVIAIERLARKPAKDPSARGGAKTDYLTHVVRDGDTWKKITLTVDPIETYDDQALTQAVLAELRSYRHGDNAVISTGLLTTFGAAGIMRMLDMAESFDDDREAMIGPSFDLERFLEGYSDAVDYVATRLRHAILCPDCGVYEDCHGEPLPCGNPRSRNTMPSPKTPANPSEQLAFL